VQVFAMSVYEHVLSDASDGPASSAEPDLVELEKCLKFRDTAAARVVARRIAVAGSELPRIIERTSLILEELRAFDLAEDLIEAATIRHPTDLWIAVRHATIASLRGEMPKATSRWRRVVQVWPGEPIGYIGRAGVELAQGNFDAATHLYQAAAALFPTYVWAADGLASVAITKQNWPEAERLWTEIQQRFPAHSRAQEQLAIARRQLRLNSLKPSDNKARTSPSAGASRPLPVVALNTSSLQVVPLGGPIGVPETGGVESLRQRTTALLAHLNTFVTDRCLRRYQADIVRTGNIDFAGLLGNETPVFSGTLYHAPPKAFAYRYVIDEVGYWLITDLAAEGYPILAAYDEGTETLLDGAVNPDTDLNGFLGQQVRDIRAVASSGMSRRLIPKPTVVLVSGFANYAHYMWNELPAMLEIERWTTTQISEIAVVYEPFGPFAQTIRWPDAPPIRSTSNFELQSAGKFHDKLLFTPGSRIVTSETRERLRQVCAAHASGSVPDDRGAFTIWISLRRMYRHATNLETLLASVIRRCEAAGLAIDIMLDGFSLPFDIAVNHRYAMDYYVHHRQLVEEQARAFIAEMSPLSRHVRLLDTTWASLATAITLAARADFYICHHGTQQHKIGWMYDVPGLIHGNAHIAAQNPHGDWTQAQCDSPIRPEYIPAQFIGDATTDNERQDIAGFRDYAFVEVETCADFVFSLVVKSHDAWLEHRRPASSLFHQRNRRPHTAVLPLS
jgi:tetratricopeptide (TPR) repeat protein